jgi:hypothetical protein
MLTLFVVSVSVTLVYSTEASSRLCPGGQEMSLGGGTVSDALASVIAVRSRTKCVR